MPVGRDPADEELMATRAATADPVLARFCRALTETYGDRLERVVLYGSRSRGDARTDSDYDVAVFYAICPTASRSSIGWHASAIR
jgi:predicted nucleotidyltransferase